MDILSEVNEIIFKTQIQETIDKATSEIRCLNKDGSKEIKRAMAIVALRDILICFRALFPLIKKTEGEIQDTFKTMQNLEKLLNYDTPENFDPFI